MYVDTKESFLVSCENLSPSIFLAKIQVTSITGIFLYKLICDIKPPVTKQPSGRLFSEMWKEPDNILVRPKIMTYTGRFQFCRN